MNELCQFTPIAPDTYRCRGGMVVRTKTLPIHARCDCRIDLAAVAARRQRGPCQFLGQETGLRDCSTCRGHVRVKEFACLHAGHAARPVTTARECQSCRDFSPSPSLPLSHSPTRVGDAERGREGEKQNRRRLLLRFRHGLGDSVQLTTVLLHLRELFPEWAVDVSVPGGHALIFRGLAGRVLCHGRENVQAGQYDLVRDLYWHEPDQCYADSPATKAEKCLREVFSIQPRPEWCRYEINIDDKSSKWADAWCEVNALQSRESSVESRGPETGPESSVESPEASGSRPSALVPRPFFVLLHYQGNSAPQKKNLDERIVAALCQEIIRLGLVPVILDWEQRSGLVGAKTEFSSPGHLVTPSPCHPLHAAPPDAASIAALAGRAAWCVGIDSGPGHIFGAVDTPTAIVWTRHHPLHYYGLAANVTHLVPVEHARYLRGDAGVGVRFFEQHYAHRVYRNLERSLCALASEVLPATRQAPQQLLVDGDVFVRRAHRQPDMVIVRDVYLEDCYRVEELPRVPQYVVDIGAHIGTFALRVHQRSRFTKVVCVEAHPGNIPALAANVSDFAEIVPAACTYESGDLVLRSTLYDGTENTGGSGLGRPSSWPSLRDRPCPEGGSEQVAGADATDGVYRLEPLATRITLEEIANRFQLPRIDVLKLDCEGSELSILEHCRLDLLRMVVGEYHDHSAFRSLLARRFAGWHVRWIKDGPSGLFWLWRPEVGSADAGKDETLSQ